MTRLWLFVRSSYWFTPMLYGVLSILLAFFSHKIDIFMWNNPELKKQLPPFLFVEHGLAQNIFSTIATSVLTMTSISFSSILVVLTTYITQFSARTLRNFMNDTNTKRILGVFISGFLFSLTLMLLVKEAPPYNETIEPLLFISPAVAVVVAFICVGFFVFFVHHVSKWIQVRNLIQHIYENTVDVMEKYMKDHDGNDDDPWDQWEKEELYEMVATPIFSPKSGYIQWLDTKVMLKQAKSEDAIVKIHKQIGEYVSKQSPIMTVFKKSTERAAKKKYVSALIIGDEREAAQDVRFGIIKLVEIGNRSLSPGINDPHTAMQCIEHLGNLLRLLSYKVLHDSAIEDEYGQLRIILIPMSFLDYIELCFAEIRHYGREDVMVLLALLNSLKNIVTFLKKSSELKEDIWTFTEQIIEGIKQQSFLESDLDKLQEKIDELSSLTVHAPEEKRSLTR
ncbi:DUF2254 domain-containing protein [Bacillus shivajii]|uniref:DUF2254 domain-containing protein n=1 Tax=Bacillus shivajii TaxID=1983719 RepID=UPI001CFBCC25|nr:DUF2254 domain-containing protein [Bacillus shivajii]UCZ52051.1 DUF2254 domain-containing protein [Bacillus shivajii]